MARQVWAITALGVGGILVYDGIHGRSAWDDVLTILRGQPLKPDGHTSSSIADSASSLAGTIGGNAAQGAVNAINKNRATLAEAQQLTLADMTQLTDIHGVPLEGMYLKPDQARAFQQAQAEYGRDIPLTSGYRTYASEVERNKSDAKRWPLPNEHIVGNAIDVYGDNMPGWLVPPARDPGVRAVLAKYGWKQWNPDGWDFMHFSWQVAA